MKLKTGNPFKVKDLTTLIWTPTFNTTELVWTSCSLIQNHLYIKMSFRSFPWCTQQLNQTLLPVRICFCGLQLVANHNNNKIIFTKMFITLMSQYGWYSLRSIVHKFNNFVIKYICYICECVDELVT
jgi:hypothetical protein